MLMTGSADTQRIERVISNGVVAPRNEVRAVHGLSPTPRALVVTTPLTGEIYPLSNEV
jgi:hypothetical protein